jgi:sporulation protein YlmC with PRC-barrel domain
MGGMKVATSATMAVKFVTVKPADVMSSKLVGIDIYNNQNEKLGEIDDLVIEGGKTVTGLVVGVGGFLGMGESYVVLDPSTVVLNQKDNVWRAFVDTNKDTLKNAPKFQYTKKKT